MIKSASRLAMAAIGLAVCQSAVADPASRQTSSDLVQTAAREHTLVLGRVIAFEDAGSTSGFLIPLAMLREHEIEAVELSSPNIRPPAGAVGYVFVGSEVNITAWDAHGIVDAGALNDTDWQDVDRTPGGLKDRLAVSHDRPEIPRSVLLVRGDLDPDLRDTLQRTLADIEADPAAEPVLETHYRVARYDAFVGDVLRDLNDVRAQYELIQDQFG